MHKTDIQKIISYIETHGRPLEKARLKYLLGEGDEIPVLEALGVYQNPDGGFGHGLEPDALNPNSSPIQTWTAMTILREIAFDKRHPLVISMVSYLEHTFDQKTMRWPALILSNNDYPHAPWWHYHVEAPSFNPSASIAGFLLKYANPLNSGFKVATHVAQEAFDYILKHENFEVHELRCLIDLILDAECVYRQYQPFLDAKAKLIHIINQTIVMTPSKWFSAYVPKPTSLIGLHPTYLSEHFIDLLYQEFDEALRQRNASGVWDITWAWQDYPEAFIKAKNDWSSIIAFGYLYLMIQTDYITFGDL